MVSKVLFLALTALLALEASGDSRLCPNKDTPKELLYEKTVHADKPLFGRVERFVQGGTPGRVPNCLVVNGLSGNSLDASTSIVSVGISKSGLNVTLVSGIQSSLDAMVSIYGE